LPLPGRFHFWLEGVLARSALTGLLARGTDKLDPDDLSVGIEVRDEHFSSCREVGQLIAVIGLAIDKPDVAHLLADDQLLAMHQRHLRPAVGPGKPSSEHGRLRS
jgi:hypothetical protein